MATFQAKIGWKIMWKRENKNYRSVPTWPVIENSNHNRVEKDEKERK